MSPSELLASPSELLASPSELLVSPSELLVPPSELSASPSELLASPSELSAPPSELLASPSELSAPPSWPHPQPFRTHFLKYCVAQFNKLNNMKAPLQDILPVEDKLRCVPCSAASRCPPTRKILAARRIPPLRGTPFGDRAARARSWWWRLGGIPQTVKNSRNFTLNCSSASLFCVGW